MENILHTLLICTVLISCCWKTSYTSYVTVKYFTDSTCNIHSFAVGVRPQKCIQTTNGSVWVQCTAGANTEGLVIDEFNNTDCSGEPNSTQALTMNVDGSCYTDPFLSTPYLQLPSSGYRISCNSNENWVGDSNDYVMSRSTYTLQATSAIDFTQDACSQNTASTEMDYCFLNTAADYCLPTDNGDNSLCSNYPTVYAYAEECMVDNPYVGFSYSYLAKTHSGKLYKSSGSLCSETSSQAFSVPYEECLGCNKFEDLGNSEDNKNHLPAWAVALIVMACIFGCFCCCGLGALIIYGSAAVVALICCRRQEPARDQKLAHQQHQQGSTANPMAQPAPVYATATAAFAPAPPAYGVETLSVQIPMEAKAGSILQATKSNGQMVQFEVPYGAQPGAIIQIQA